MHCSQKTLKSLVFLSRLIKTNKQRRSCGVLVREGSAGETCGVVGLQRVKLAAEMINCETDVTDLRVAAGRRG